jgi:Na+-transporting methylmalonyl-CoA/oxaloacetate decarboxylase gamma subunit
LTASGQESYHIYNDYQCGEAKLKDLSFGLTMTFWGMGVTLATLGLLILIIRLMNKMYPVKKEDDKKD